MMQLPWMYREDDDLFEVYPSDEAMGGPANEGAVWAPICREIYKEEDAAFIVRACNNHKALLQALNNFVEEQIDYMTINHLGDPEKQHNIKLARTAIANAEKG